MLLDLDYSFHLRAFERETPRHDEADIAGTDYHDFPAGQQAVDIYKLLRKACGKYAGGAVTRNMYHLARPLAAAGSHYDGFRSDGI